MLEVGYHFISKTGKSFSAGEMLHKTAIVVWVDIIKDADSGYRATVPVDGGPSLEAVVVRHHYNKGVRCVIGNVTGFGTGILFELVFIRFHSVGIEFVDFYIINIAGTFIGGTSYSGGNCEIVPISFISIVR